MKNKIIHFFSILFLVTTVIFLTNACKEIGPAIDLTGSGAAQDTTFVTTPDAAQAKVILLEEFTGVRCINCANGHVAAASLKAANPGRVYSIALHSFNLDEPYLYSFIDLTLDKAEQIQQAYAAGTSKPSSMIDRVLFPGESSPAYLLAKWPGYVSTRLAATTPVNVELTNNYNNATRELEIKLKIQYTALVTDQNSFTIYLAENNLITAQLMPTGDVDTNYVHNDVMREIITPNGGSSLPEAAVVGRTYLKTFKITIPEDFDPSELEVIAFVHKTGASNEILQTAVKKIL